MKKKFWICPPSNATNVSKILSQEKNAQFIKIIGFIYNVGVYLQEDMCKKFIKTNLI